MKNVKLALKCHWHKNSARYSGNTQHTPIQKLGLQVGEHQVVNFIVKFNFHKAMYELLSLTVFM